MRIRVKVIERLDVEPLDHLRSFAKVLVGQGYSIIWKARDEFEAISPHYHPIKGYEDLE